VTDLRVHGELEEDALNVILLSSGDASYSDGFDGLLRSWETYLIVIYIVN